MPPAWRGLILGSRQVVVPFVISPVLPHPSHSVIGEEVLGGLKGFIANLLSEDRKHWLDQVFASFQSFSIGILGNR